MSKSQSQLVEMAKRNLAHVKAGSVDQAPDVYRVPATNYYDPERFTLEMERIFKRLPLVLGFSAELREPGSYRAMQVADTPVLLTRAADGKIRAFLNVCSHRGAIVAPEGHGRARRFSCPYHGWSYDNRGALVGITNHDEFGTVDTGCLGLTALPVAERAGIDLHRNPTAREPFRQRTLSLPVAVHLDTQSPQRFRLRARYIAGRPGVPL